MWTIIIKIAIGFFIGAICGAVSLIYGIIKKSYILGILGDIISSIVGAIFSIVEKSPFTSIVVAIIFLFFIIIKNKKEMSEHHDDDESDIA